MKLFGIKTPPVAFELQVPPEGSAFKNIGSPESHSGPGSVIIAVGSGKTLITKLIGGIIRPDQGSIQIKEKKSKIS